MDNIQNFDSYINCILLVGCKPKRALFKRFHHISLAFNSSTKVAERFEENSQIFYCITPTYNICSSSNLSTVDWIGLAPDKDRRRALVSSVLNLRVPKNAGKLSSVLTTLGLSSGAQLHRLS
jgi:hypothetical protein